MLKFSVLTCKDYSRFNYANNFPIIILAYSISKSESCNKIPFRFK
jgi:hypothetical protein